MHGILSSKRTLALLPADLTLGLHEAQVQHHRPARPNAFRFARIYFSPLAASEYLRAAAANILDDNVEHWHARAGGNWRKRGVGFHNLQGCRGARGTRQFGH